MTQASAQIIDARKTPIGRVGGRLDGASAEGLFFLLVSGLLEEHSIASEDIDDVLLGNAAGAGGHLAQISALATGLSATVPAVTIEQPCASSPAVVEYASVLVAEGTADCIIAGGLKSVSAVPWRLSRLQGNLEIARVYTRARFRPLSMDDPDMGTAAEAVATRCGVTRRDLDEIATYSRVRATQVRDSGLYDAEIVSVRFAGNTITTEEYPCSRLSTDEFARLRPAFVEGGTGATDNSWPIIEGGSIVLVESKSGLERHDSTFVLKIVGHSTGGVDLNEFRIAAFLACERLFAVHYEINVQHLDVVGANQPFAAQALASLQLMGINPLVLLARKMAPCSGAPYGASRAIVLTPVFHQLDRKFDTRPLVRPRGYRRGRRSWNIHISQVLAPVNNEWSEPIVDCTCTVCQQESRMSARSFTFEQRISLETELLDRSHTCKNPTLSQGEKKTLKHTARNYGLCGLSTSQLHIG